MVDLQLGADGRHRRRVSVERLGGVADEPPEHRPHPAGRVRPRMRSAPLPSRRMRCTPAARPRRRSRARRGAPAPARRRPPPERAGARRTTRSSRRARRARRGTTTRSAPRRARSRRGRRRTPSPTRARARPGPPPRRAAPARPSPAPRPCRAAGAGGCPTTGTCSRGGRRRRPRSRDGRDVVVPVGERARDHGAREAAEQLRAGGREAGVAAVPVRRVGCKRLQQRQVRAQAVADGDRGRGVRHADVDVQRGRRRALEQPAHRVVDVPIARVLDVQDVGEAGLRVQAGAGERVAGGAQIAAAVLELEDGVRDVVADRGGALDHRLVHVGLDVRGVKERDGLAGAVIQRMRGRCRHEQELLLDAERERRGAERVLHVDPSLRVVETRS